MPRGLVQTCIRREGRAALAFGLGVERFQEQGQVSPLFASPFFFSRNGAFTECLEEMLLVVFPTPTPVPSNQGKRSLVLKQSGSHWIAVPGPSSQSGQQGCSRLTVAVALLTCEF